MKITKQEIYNVANLARLNISENQVDLFCNQLGNILEYMEKLNKIDTTNIKPTTHAIDLSNAFRDDILKPSINTELAIQNAPAKEDSFFVVPKVVG